MITYARKISREKERMTQRRGFHDHPAQFDVVD